MRSEAYDDNRPQIDFDAINNAARAVLPTLLARWLPGGKLTGREYTALNPRRADKHQGSFKTNADSGAWQDFATEDRGSDPVSLLAFLNGTNQVEAAIQLATELGIEQENLAAIPSRRRESAEQRRPKKDNTTVAIAIWHDARRPENTTVSRYLLGRGLTGQIPQSIRFHPQLRHGESNTCTPAMVAAVHGPRGDIIGVHRTYLRSDGASKADVRPPRMALGHIKGGAVRLSPVSETLVLVEGIEDALAVLRMTGQTTWAVLGTAGFQNFVPPRGVRRIILAPDGDTAGRSVIGPAGDRLLKMGFQVEVALAPSGRDWNDVLLEFDERAAIREFCNGECRENAEEMALQEIMRSPDVQA